MSNICYIRLPDIESLKYRPHRSPARTKYIFCDICLLWVLNVMLGVTSLLHRVLSRVDWNIKSKFIDIVRMFVNPIIHISGEYVPFARVLFFSKDTSVQERRNSIDNALELRLFSLNHWHISVLHNLVEWHTDTKLSSRYMGMLT